MTEMRWWRPGPHPDWLLDEKFVPKTLGRAMLEEVGPAVQYVLVNDAAAWGAVTKGAAARRAVTKGAEAWALRQVKEELERIIGLVSTGVLGSATAAVDGLSDDARAKAAEENEALQAEWVEEQGPKGLAFAEIDALTFADVWIQSFAWPWDRDEGAHLCRASMLVIDAAKRIAPGWDGLAKWQKHLAESDGPAAWECTDERPSLALVVLVSAAAWTWREDKRRAKMPTATLHPLAAAAAAATLNKEGDFYRSVNSLVKGGRSRGLEPVASLVVSSQITLSDVDTAKALTVCVMLSRLGHAQWVKWTDDYSRVAVPIKALHAAGVVTDGKKRDGKKRDEEKRDGKKRDGKKRDEEKRDDEKRSPETQALELFHALSKVEVTGLGHLIVPGSINIVSQSTGGRPARFVVARLGDPLVPYGVIDWFDRMELEVPDGLAFWAAALNPEWASMVGQKKSFAAQRAAYAAVVPQWLMAQKHEYAKGGVALATLGPVLKAFGLLLPDSWIKGLLVPPKQLVPGGPTSALLVEVKGRPGLVTLGDGHPEYKAFDARLLNAAGAGKRKAAAMAAKAAKAAKAHR